ncbi:MAG: hypothetical protein AAFX65_08210 [Cyanobacteria bacterium J06638_7]
MDSVFAPEASATAASHRPALLRAGAVAVVALATCASALPGGAAVMGGARALPYDQAVDRTRSAATAVLSGKGEQSCLRGKLTNALLVMVASCKAAGETNALCDLSRQAVVQPTWSFPFMETTSQDLLDLISARGGLP